MEKKKYIAPETCVYVTEEVMFQSFSVVKDNGTTKEKVDGGLVIEDKDPDGKTDGSWFDNTDNWGGD